MARLIRIRSRILNLDLVQSVDRFSDDVWTVQPHGMDVTPDEALEIILGMGLDERRARLLLGLQIPDGAPYR